MLSTKEPKLHLLRGSYRSSAVGINKPVLIAFLSKYLCSNHQLYESFFMDNYLLYKFKSKKSVLYYAD